MTEVWLDPEPAEALRTLAGDGAHAALRHAIERTLDALAENPQAPWLRRRRFLTPPLWCVLVATASERWVVLWEPLRDRPDAVAIRHIGPATFA